MPTVVMYSSQVCPYCRMAEKLLASKGVHQIEKILIDSGLTPGEFRQLKK